MYYINKLKKIAIKYHPNEYFCHVYFVYKIALKLQKQYGGNKKIISAAALLHDIGRDYSSGCPHEIAGAKIAQTKLKRLGWPKKIIEAVKQCIRSHNHNTYTPYRLEEKIIASADSAAKIIYAPLFGLLSNKASQDKPAWILKHIKKSYQDICLSNFKTQIKPIYTQMQQLYQEVIKEKEDSIMF
jgi:putative nucleotidyltransferase with HDIG domain